MQQRCLLGILVFFVPLVLVAQPVPPRLDINGPRVLQHLEALSAFGRTPEGGISRVAFSQADREGRVFVIGLMRAAGLDVRVDAAGNIIGRRQGRERDLPPLMLGSHIDSVPNGGNYDGQVGSIGAIEVAQMLDEAGVVTRHPVEVVIFANEEAGKMGSRAVSGELEMAELDLVSHSGKTNREGIAFIGGSPTELASARRTTGDLTAYLELHIEQGAVLENQAITIGVVEGIVGIRRWNVVFEGLSNHAGTTPMGDRKDALLAAARFVVAVNRIVTSISGRHVGTVGRLEASPGVPNVIAGRARASLELRDLDMDKMETMYREIHDEAERIARETGTTVVATQFNISHSAPTDERLRQIIAGVATDLGLTHMRLPSGAGHDAQSMARLAPAGMIFIPSVNGISHSPQEFSRPEDIVNGVRVLLETLLQLDAAPGGDERRVQPVTSRRAPSVLTPHEEVLKAASMRRISSSERGTPQFRGFLPSVTPGMTKGASQKTDHFSRGLSQSSELRCRGMSPYPSPGQARNPAAAYDAWSRLHTPKPRAGVSAHRRAPPRTKSPTGSGDSSRVCRRLVTLS